MYSYCLFHFYNLVLDYIYLYQDLTFGLIGCNWIYINTTKYQDIKNIDHVNRQFHLGAEGDLVKLRFERNMAVHSRRRDLI